MQSFEDLAPIDMEGGFLNEDISKLWKDKKLLDVARYHSYLPDYIILNRIRENMDLAIYVAVMRGIVNLSTIANVKVFFCDLSKPMQSQRSHQNPSYNNKETKGKHRRGRKGSA